MTVVAGVHNSVCMQRPFDSTELADETILSGVGLSASDLRSSCCRALRSIFGGNK